MYDLYSLDGRLLKSFEDRDVFVEVLKLIPPKKTKVLIKELDMFIATEDYLDNPKTIASFDEIYDFLSNFYTQPFEYNGLTFMNSEAAFQAQKDLSKSQMFCTLKAGDAKHLGKDKKQIHLRKDWGTIKYQIMYEVVKAKFTSSTLMKKLLLLTGDSKLVEGNTWGDTTWGVCKGIGKNYLGKILMRVRKEIALEEGRDFLC